MSKLVYLFDAATKELSGEYMAQESPLEPGVFLEPESSTDVTPPAPVLGKALCFIAGAWQQVDDIRGIWYPTEGGALDITSLLEAVPAGALRTPQPMTAEQLAASKLRALTEAKELRAEIRARLNDIHLEAIYNNDVPPVIAAIMAAKQSLRDITIHPSVVAAVDYDTTKAAIMTQYYAIVATLSVSAPAAVSAFTMLDQ